MITKYLISVLAIISAQTITAEVIRLSEVKQLSFRTNKTEYLPGDSILVHYWVIDPTTQQPTTIEGGVTLQLLDKDGLEISSTRSLPTEKGATAFVQAPYSKGVHFLRAYTDEMLNIPEELTPSTPIYINALEQDFALYPNQKITAIPEGGVLIPKFQQRIVISAPYYIGDSVFIYNKTRKLQTESMISEYGNTLVMLTPEDNENYTIQIKDKEIPLTVTPNTATLQLTQNQDKIIYSILSNQSITKISNTKLKVYAGSELLHSSDVDDTTTNGYFDISKLPNTLLTFLLTQHDSVQIAQRAIFTDAAGMVSKKFLNNVPQNSTNTATLKAVLKDIDPEQSYRVYINTFKPLLTDIIPVTTKQIAHINDYFDDQLPAAKRHFVIDLLMIQESKLLASDFKNVYINGYSNRLQGKVKKEVAGAVDDGKIIAINALTRDLSEAPLSKGGIFNIDLGAFTDSTSFYLQAYNKKGKSNFFVIEIDSIYKPDFVPTHGKIKKAMNTFSSREQIKDIAFEDVIPEVNVTAKKKKKHVEASKFYEGRTFTAQKIRDRSFHSLEQIINSMYDVRVASIPSDPDEKTFEKVIFNNRTQSIISNGYVPIVSIMIDNSFFDFEQANNFLDVNDIEEIEYIPAIRATIYGARAFNGVVRIETKSGWREQLAPSQGIKFYPKGFSERTERASWHKPDNQCIVVTGKELLDGTIIATTDPIESIFVEGFDKSGKIIQQRITLND